MTIASTFRLACVAIGVLMAVLPAWADGVLRFEREILPKLQKGRLAYERLQPLGADGFALEKVVVFSAAEGGRPAVPSLRIARLEVENLDFEGFVADEIRFAKIRVSGLMVPEGGEYGVMSKRYGLLPSGPSNGRLEYRFDRAAQTLTVSRLELTTPTLSLALDMVLDKVTSLGSLGIASGNVVIRSAKVRYEDRSALGRALRSLAGQTGKSEEAQLREWLTTLAVLSSGRGPETTHAADALASFVQDYRQPKGPLSITLRPAKPTSIGAYAPMLLAPDPAKVLGLAAGYPGTRPGAAALALIR